MRFEFVLEKKNIINTDAVVKNTYFGYTSPQFVAVFKYTFKIDIVILWERSTYLVLRSKTENKTN